MREIIRRFQTGETVSASEFNNGGLDFFSDVVWPMALKEEATRQLGFDQDIYYTRTHPIEDLTPEQERLNRPVELKNGITRTIDCQRFDTDLDRMRITEIRKELAEL